MEAANRTVRQEREKLGGEAEPVWGVETTRAVAPPAHPRRIEEWWVLAWGSGQRARVWWLSPSW